MYLENPSTSRDTVRKSLKESSHNWHDHLLLRFTHYQQTAASVWAVRPDIKLLLSARAIGHWLAAFLFDFGWSVINMILAMPHRKQTHWMFLRKRWPALGLNWSPVQNWKEHLCHFSLEIPVKIEYICILSRYTSSVSMILYAEVLVTKPLCFNNLFSLKENNTILHYTTLQYCV